MSNGPDMRSVPLWAKVCSTKVFFCGCHRRPGQIPKHTELLEVLKRSILKPQQFGHTLNVPFKHTKVVGPLLAQPLPPLIVHDSVRNMMSHAMKAADADK